MTEETHSGYDAIFVGGGVIGLASAWRAAHSGARVCVLEAERPAAGATGVAAGMLAPAGEASWGEEDLLSLNLESLRRWPGFADQLQSASGIEIGFAQRGALHVALDRDEAESLRRRHELQRRARPGFRVAYRRGVQEARARSRHRGPRGGARPG